MSSMASHTCGVRCNNQRTCFSLPGFVWWPASKTHLISSNNCVNEMSLIVSRWFQIFCILTPTRTNDPFWLYCSDGVGKKPTKTSYLSVTSYTSHFVSQPWHLPDSCFAAVFVLDVLLRIIVLRCHFWKAKQPGETEVVEWWPGMGWDPIPERSDPWDLGILTCTWKP